MLVLAYLLLGFFYVPKIIQQQLQKQLQTNLNMQAEMSKVSFNPLTFTTAINDLQLTDSNNQNWYQSKQTGINFDPTNLLWGEWKFSDLNLKQPQITLLTDAKGQVLIPALPDFPTSPEPQEYINFSIDKITLTQGKMNLQANNIKQDFSLGLKTIEISHDQFSLADIDTNFNIKITTEDDEVLTLNGSYNHPQQNIQSKLSLINWQAQTLNKVLPDKLMIKTQGGMIQANGQVNWELSQKPILNFSDVKIQDLNTQWQDHIQLDTFQANITDVEIDTQTQKINIETIDSSNANWQLNWPVTVESSNTDNSVDEADSTWQIDINHINIKKWPVTITDDDINSSLSLQVTQLDLQGVNNSNQQFSATSQIDLTQGGTLSFNSKQQLSPLDIQTELILDAIELTQFAPWIADESGLVFTQGKLNTKQNIKINDDFMLTGDLSINDANIQNQSAQPIADWNQLNIAATSISSAEKTITIDQISLDNANSNIIIDPNKNINIQNLKSDSDDKDTEKTENDWVIKVGAINIKDTSTALIDESITPTVKTSISELSGQIKGLSSETLSKADVDISGKFNQFSPLSIQGKINPLSSDAYTDLKVVIKDLDLLVFSPYAIQSVAFPINGGKLDVELEYSLNQHELRGKNNLLFKQFKLGSKTPSPDAVDLPLKLAVSLLTDLNGEMKINLPVSGNLNDPEFSYGGLVGKAFFKLITSIVASPFKILGALIPNPDPNLSDIQFTSGSAEILESEQTKLNQIAEIIAQKPDLNLQLNPQIDPAFDTAGLKETSLLEKAPFATFDTDNADVTTWLEVQITPEELATYHNAQDEVDYPLIWKALIDRQQISEEQINALVQQRNLNIKNYLIENANISAEKVFVEQSQIQNNNQSLIKIGVSN